MEIVELGKLCKFLDSQRVPVTASDRNHGIYPYYGANGIQGWVDDFIFDEPLILLAEDGGHFGSKTKPIAYKITGKSWVNNHAHVIRPKSNCDIDYLHHILSYYDISNFINGATRPKLTKGNAEQIPIPLPKPDEQKRIAAILDKADRLRRQRRFAQTLSDSFLQSVFIKMFGEQLNEDFPNTELIKLAKITGGGTPSRAVEEYFTGKIAWLTSKDMRGDYIFDTQEHITEDAINNSATKLVPKGSILMVVKSKVLMNRLPLAISEIPICHGQDIKSIQCSKKVNSLFLLYVLKYNEGKLLRLARGANTEGLTLPMIESVPVPNVPLPLQEKFAEIVQKFERVRRQQREATRHATHLFQTLLHRAFRGEL